MSVTPGMESDRLLIQPLNYDQVIHYQTGRPLLIEGSALEYPVHTVPPELVEVLSDFILPKLRDAGASYLYHTLWLIREKNSGQLVGSFLFKGVPDEQGCVEIGYGTEAVFQGRGYMTEALSATLRWASNRPDITTVTAETEAGNLASIQVLKKNNFEPCGQKGTLLYWRKSCK